MTLASSTSVSDALPHLEGMIMVFVTLTLLWAVCVIIGWLIRILPQSPSANPTILTEYQNAPTDESDPPEDSNSSDDIPSHIAAIIAAAVVTVTDRSHRIISIKPQPKNWGKAGRQSILTSHRIR